jgi:hypothetical protein
MRIVSKFKDYYDGGAMYGVDQTHVFLRKTETIECIELSQYPRYNVLGFCGELYLFTTALIELPNITFNFNPDKHIIWNEEIVTHQFEAKQSPRSMNYAVRKCLAPLGQQYIYRYSAKERRKRLEYTLDNREIQGLFLKYKTPLFLLHRVGNNWAIELNPILRNLAFYKLQSVTQAYQRIEQYITNELVQETQGKVPVGNDEVIGRSKGFNEFSFRNTKEGSKPKKW